MEVSIRKLIDSHRIAENIKTNGRNDNDEIDEAKMKSGCKKMDTKLTQSNDSNSLNATVHRSSSDSPGNEQRFFQ